MAAVRKREPQGGQRVGLDDGGEVGPEAVRQRLDEHRSQRNGQEQRQECEREPDEQPPDDKRLGQRALLRARRAQAAFGRGGRHHADTLRVVFACRMLIASSSAKETSSMTKATAVAPA